MALGMEVVLSPGHVVLNVLHVDPAPQYGHTPNSRPISVVAKRSPISATAEYLFIYMCFWFKWFLSGVAQTGSITLKMSHVL